MSVLGTAVLRNQSATTTNWPEPTRIETLCIQFLNFLVVLQESRSNLEIICMNLWVLSLPAVTADSFLTDVAKKVAAGDWAYFLGLDVVRYFILFDFWFMIQDY